MFMIEKNVPLPQQNGSNVFGNKSPYPLSEMEIGDSFIERVAWTNIQRTVCEYGKRHGKKFAIRNMGEGVRVWRVA